MTKRKVFVIKRERRRPGEGGRTYPVGICIIGTSRMYDFIPAFLTELDQLSPLTHEERSHMAEVHKRAYGGTRQDSDAYFISDAVYDDYEWLVNTLSSKAGPLMYFGANEGSSTDYGFWLDPMWREQLNEECGLIESDIEDVPADHHGLALVINDHGNMTLYMCWQDGRGRSRNRVLWSIV